MGSGYRRRGKRRIVRATAGIRKERNSASRSGWLGLGKCVVVSQLSKGCWAFDFIPRVFLTTVFNKY